ncbi:unnamed protein product [Urochloa humidicola]
MEMGRRKKGPAARASSRPCLDSAAAAPRSRSLAAGARTGARRGSSNRPLSAPFASNPAARRRRRRRGEGGSRSGGAAKEHDLDPLRAREAEEEVDRPAREPGRRRARGAVAAPRSAGRRCPGARWSFGRRGAAGRRPAGSTLLRRLLEGGASSGHRELREWCCARDLTKIGIRSCAGWRSPQWQPEAWAVADCESATATGHGRTVAAST